MDIKFYALIILAILIYVGVYVIGYFFGYTQAREKRKGKEMKNKIAAVVKFNNHEAFVLKRKPDLKYTKHDNINIGEETQIAKLRKRYKGKIYDHREYRKLSKGGA